MNAQVVSDLCEVAMIEARAAVEHELGRSLSCAEREAFKNGFVAGSVYGLDLAIADLQRTK